ncbi:hypothetical protein GTA08_BOTSDO02851 [Botryosphaeria dothidea]|uniref:PBP domain-containing protein n=1 Tax=Botryosphaeria dothidea TaxID=55169 RepID=A0A8H4IXQ8_9PEZI|nr:hypothetical protein GTA08_BOTSDO02851 [Botryosphaeria dothidea]
MSAPKTSVQPHGEIDSKPKAVYGKGDLLLRLGNGGAGATGLLEALANDYLSTLPHPRSITWVCNHSSNTQLALFRGYIDLAFTYERDNESLAASEGWSHTAGCVFHDHFCIAGPVSDPAGLRSVTSLGDALRKIAKQNAVFHSRADGSATMAKERDLWSAAGLRPWDSQDAAGWYKTSLDTPADALRRADAAGAYLLTDRSTVLRQTALRTISSTTVFIEPESLQDPLMNSCYALYSTSGAGERFGNVIHFLDYLFSDRGQNVIGSFGRDEAGLPFFATLKEGFAKTTLAGGMPKDGKWMSFSKL